MYAETHCEATEDLDFRAADGVEVTLLWARRSTVFGSPSAITGRARSSSSRSGQMTTR